MFVNSSHYYTHVRLSIVNREFTKRRPWPVDSSSSVHFDYLLFVMGDWHLTVILLRLCNLMRITNNE